MSNSGENEITYAGKTKIFLNPKKIRIKRRQHRLDRIFSSLSEKTSEIYLTMENDVFFAGIPIDWFENKSGEWCPQMPLMYSKFTWEIVNE